MRKATRSIRTRSGNVVGYKGPARAKDGGQRRAVAPPPAKPPADPINGFRNRAPARQGVRHA